MKQLLESSLPELSHFLVAIKSPNRAESSKKTARNGVMSESQTKRLILERECNIRKRKESFKQIYFDIVFTGWKNKTKKRG